MPSGAEAGRIGGEEVDDFGNFFGVAGSTTGVEGVFVAPVILYAATVYLNELLKEIIAQGGGANGSGTVYVGIGAGVAFDEHKAVGHVQGFLQNSGGGDIDVHEADVPAFVDKLHDGAAPMPVEPPVINTVLLIFILF